MKRYITGAGIGLALFAGAVVFVPHAVQAASSRAGTGSIQLASAVRTHVVLHAVTRSAALKHVAAHVNRGTATHAYVGTAAGRYHGTAVTRTYGATTYARLGYGRYGMHTYSRLGYSTKAGYGASGTTPSCPHMGTTTTTTSGK